MINPIEIMIEALKANTNEKFNFISNRNNTIIVIHNNFIISEIKLTDKIKIYAKSTAQIITSIGGYTFDYDQFEEIIKLFEVHERIAYYENYHITLAKHFIRTNYIITHIYQSEYRIKYKKTKYVIDYYNKNKAIITNQENEAKIIKANNLEQLQEKIAHHIKAKTAQLKKPALYHSKQSNKTSPT